MVFGIGTETNLDSSKLASSPVTSVPDTMSTTDDTRVPPVATALAATRSDEDVEKTSETGAVHESPESPRNVHGFKVRFS